ncbi:hypothetical protein DVH24_039823 [Malus domestica]|uniref:Uncharacterized protein n=1 Tax=Malus domestica TaxID=3750 RepID=A0A498I6K9_MALDO|nr:hypothetical protein DVH24_039823 [Malus domestica]
MKQILYACHFWVDFAVPWSLQTRSSFGSFMVVILVVAGQRQKVFSDVFTFGLIAFDVFLFSFAAGALLSHSHISGFHVCDGGSGFLRVMFDSSFDRLKMTHVASLGWMLQYHLL